MVIRNKVNKILWIIPVSNGFSLLFCVFDRKTGIPSVQDRRIAAGMRIRRLRQILHSGETML